MGEEPLLACPCLLDENYEITRACGRRCNGRNIAVINDDDEIRVIDALIARLVRTLAPALAYASGNENGVSS